MNQAFHEGERHVQQLVGVRDKLALLGDRLIRDQLPEQHRQFFAQLPFLLIGVVDAAGQPWASALANPPGFIQSPDARTLQIHAHAAQGDPLHHCLAPGSPVGLLGIEPHTRRRNRVNGLVERVFDAGFAVRVQQSFGNCPKYIHPRKATYLASNAARPKRAEQLQELDAQARRIILGADTFFIATAYPATDDADDAGETRHGVDVSHRGGPPGFVRFEGDDTLSIADFVGNSFFNTIGNIALNPRAGLLFVDFESGDLLQLAVDAEILWNESTTTASPETTTRRLRFRVRQVRRISASLPLLWEQETR